jgi:retinoid hydroxylase
MNKITKNTALPLPPGNLGLPYFGETRAIKRDREAYQKGNRQTFNQERRQKYGNIFKTRFFGVNYIFLASSEANQFILSNENKYFVNSSFGNSQTLFGRKTLTWQRGQKHKNSRRVLAQAFQNKAFERYIESIQTISKQYFEQNKDNKVALEKPELKKYVYDVMGKILFGVEAISQTEIISWLESLPSGLVATPLPLPWTKYGRALQNRQKLLNEIDRAIARHNLENDFESSALGILIKAQQQVEDFDIEELKEQVINLWFLASNELSSALASLCQELKQHPEVVELINLEQEKLNKTATLSLEKIRQMTYLEQVIKEVLRLNPPVPGGIRQVIKDCSFNGYRLPVGWKIVYRIDATLKDSNIYSQPDRFDPNRFSPERAEDKQQPYSYIPFGGGMRECMGRELSFLVIKIFALALIESETSKLL